MTEFLAASQAIIMAPISLKKTIQQYKSLSTNLESKIQQLYSKRSELESRGFVVIEETSRPSSVASAANSPAAQNEAVAANLRESPPPGSISQKIVARGVDDTRRQRRGKSPSSPPDISSVLEASVEQDRAVARPLDVTRAGNLGASLNPALVREDRERMPSLIEETVLAHSSDITSLVSTATNILIESMQLRLSYVQEVLNKLTSIWQENSKLPAPPELLFSRYEEWVQRNQRLIELNSQLYDLEKLKFELKEKRSKVQTSSSKGHQRQRGDIEKTLTGV